jgi:hypothetical protein
MDPFLRLNQCWKHHRLKGILDLTVARSLQACLFRPSWSVSWTKTMMARFLVATEEPLAADPTHLKAVCVHVDLTFES